MLGFPKKAIYVVIVILFIAYYAGGLWLVLPIVLALTWYVIEQQEGKKAATTSQPLDEPTPTQAGGAKNQSGKPGKAIDWATKLTEICSNYSAKNYYVSEFIPGMKLKKAQKAYPLPNGGKVIALIDTTLLGEASFGMLISENGISWNNRSIETKVSVLGWKELSDMTLSKDGCKIIFGDIGVFDFMYEDCVMEEIIELLKSIRLTYVEYNKHLTKTPTCLKEKEATTSEFVCEPIPTHDVKKHVEGARDHSKKVGKEDKILRPADIPTPAKVDVVDVNFADFDQLLSLPGIWAAEAKLIVDRRSSGVFFVSLDEMTEFLDLKPHKAEQLRSRVVFSKPTSLSPAASQKKPSSPQTNSLIRPNVASPTTPSPSKSGVGRVID